MESFPKETKGGPLLQLLLCSVSFIFLTLDLLCQIQRFVMTNTKIKMSKTNKLRGFSQRNKWWPTATAIAGPKGNNEKRKRGNRDRDSANLQSQQYKILFSFGDQIQFCCPLQPLKYTYKNTNIDSNTKSYSFTPPPPLSLAANRSITGSVRQPHSQTTRHILTDKISDKCK